VCVLAPIVPLCLALGKVRGQGKKAQKRAKLAPFSFGNTQSSKG